MSKKVLIVSNFIEGLILFRKELIRELAAEGYDVYITTPVGEDEKIRIIENMGAKYAPCHYDRSTMNPVKDTLLLLRYIKLLKKIRPMGVLNYTIKPCVYMGIACRLLRVPYIGTVTGINPKVFTEKTLIRWIVTLLYKIGLKGAECIYYQNQANQELFHELRIGAKLERMIPGSGVNLKEHQLEKYPIEEQKIRFLFLGRIIKIKGIEELCSAVKTIRKKYSKDEVEFVFCGSEDEQIEIFKELVDNGDIIWKGHINNVREQLIRCNALIMPSHAEGMSNVLLEAAATGRPVIASDIPGCRETFENGIGGYAFPRGDVEALTDCILQFIGLPYSEKIEMGCKARKYVETIFDRQIIVNEYMKVIDAMVKRNA